MPNRSYLRRSDADASKTRLTCQRCGDPLIGCQRIWCGRDCQEIAEGKRQAEPLADRKCWCGEQFTPTSSAQVCCPPTDEDRVRVKGQARSKCARAYMNAKQRGTLDALLGRGRPGAPFDCEWCGKPCVPGSDVPCQATRFCTRAHNRAWHAEHNPDYHLSRPAVLRSFTAPATPHQEVAYRRAMRQDPCAYCGEPSQQLDHIEPRSKGGEDDWENRAGTCARCNNRKQDVPMLIWMGWKLHADEFDPWNEARRSLLAR